MCAKTVMVRSSNILRWVCLSLLFGGSIAVVVAAITLVKAAEAQGIPVSQAASANAPVFLVFSKIALAAGLALIVSEAMDYAVHRVLKGAVILRYAASVLCAATTMVFALGIVPPMEQLRSVMHSNPAAYTQFKSLHETSRMVFGATILLAFVSLASQAFQAEAVTSGASQAKV